MVSNTHGILFLLFLFRIGSTSIVLGEKTNQEGWAYKQDDCKGDYYELDMNAAMHEGWKNVIRSVKIRGIWIFYEKEAYNELYNGLVEYYYSEKVMCRNLGRLKGKVMSARYANDKKDYKKDRLDTYRRASFMDKVGYATGDMNTNMDDIQSVILGGTEPWTFYSEKNYKGDSICLYPEVAGVYQPTFVSDLGLILPPNFPPNSYKKGCYSSHSMLLGDDF